MLNSLMLMTASWTANQVLQDATQIIHKQTHVDSDKEQLDTDV